MTSEELLTIIQAKLGSDGESQTLQNVCNAALEIAADEITKRLARENASSKGFTRSKPLDTKPT